MTGLRAGWRAGGHPSRCWYPAFSRTVLWGTGRRVQGCSSCRAFPARGSPAAATRAAGSRGRGGLHGNTDVMDLESLNAASRPPPGPGAAVASLSSGWDLRGVGAATLPPAGSRPGHQKQTAVNRASQVSPASHLPDAPLSSKHSQLAASSRDLTSCFINRKPRRKHILIQCGR